ncbi:MAG TPA: hypothetical protein VGI10_21110 [Polyangiaceae bacterium]
MSKVIHWGFVLVVCASSWSLPACSNRAPEPTSSAVPAPTAAAVAPANSVALVEALRSHLSRTSAGLTAHDGQNGLRVLPLEGRYHSAQIAHRAPDGSLRVECVTSVKELESSLAARQP